MAKDNSAFRCGKGPGKDYPSNSPHQPGKALTSVEVVVTGVWKALTSVESVLHTLGNYLHASAPAEQVYT